MRRCAAFIVTGLLGAGSLLGTGTLLADQTDARLDGLFEVLLQTKNGNTIRATENEIWELWLQHPNADVVQLMTLGTERMNFQRYDDALLIFSQVIDRFPEFAEAWNKRATLYYIVGNYDASLADIERTLLLEPRHFGALSGMGLVYLQRRELTKARQAFEDLIRIHPNSPNAQENLKLIVESQRLQII
jgi:tetratricopeptide (TPR) repeat protein